MASDTSLPVELAALLTHILREEVDPHNLDANLSEHYGANSMDMVDIVETIERKYNVRISNDQIPLMRTLGDLTGLIEAKRRTREVRPDLDPESVAQV